MALPAPKAAAPAAALTPRASTPDQCPHCGKAITLETRVPLTQRQLGILIFVARHVRKHGFPPSYLQIMREFNLASSATISEHIEQIERKGWLKRNPEFHRSIELKCTLEELVP